MLQKGHFASEKDYELKNSLHPPTTSLSTDRQSSNLTNQICSFSPVCRLARLCSAVLFIYLGDAWETRTTVIWFFFHRLYCLLYTILHKFSTEDTKITNKFIFFLSETILTKTIYRRKKGLMSCKNQSLQVASCASYSANDPVFRTTEI